jgi:hypothetical protein
VRVAEELAGWCRRHAVGAARDLVGTLTAGGGGAATRP